MLESKLNNLNEYIRAIKFNPDGITVEVVFKDGWSITPSNRFKLKSLGDESNDGLISCVIYNESNDGATINEFLEYAQKIVSKNLELEAKDKFLEAKVVELAELVKKTPLSKLKTLEFTFKDIALTSEIKNGVIDTADTIPKESLNVTPIILEDNNIVVKDGLEVQEFPETTCVCNEDQVCPICAASKGF